MSGEKPFLAICNPAAGGGRCGQQAGPVIDRLRAAGIPIDVQMTAAAGQATEIARGGWRSGYRRFLAMGGDGTSFEVVNGLFPEAEAGPEPPVLGFLPLGTGNSFLRDFSPQAADYSVDSILQGRERSCDVLRLRHKAGDTF